MKTAGEILKEERERKGISIQHVSRETKISAKYIEAMEKDDYSIFPGEVYAKGFLRLYCGFLGLDAEELVNKAFSKESKSLLEEEIKYETCPDKTVNRGRLLDRFRSFNKSGVFSYAGKRYLLYFTMFIVLMFAFALISYNFHKQKEEVFAPTVEGQIERKVPFKEELKDTSPAQEVISGKKDQSGLNMETQSLKDMEDTRLMSPEGER
jgi:cytoskeletal protein RodZ